MMRGLGGAVAVLLLGGVMSPRGAAAQTGFNGVITFLSERDAGKQDTFVQYTKGRKIRIDGFGGQQGAMIVDNDAKVVMIVEPAKKQYMTMTEDDAKQMQAMMGPMMEQMKSKRKDAGKLSFAKTGKTETVAGVPCEVWRGEYTDDEGKKDEGEACVAAGVGLELGELTYNNPMMMQRGAAHDQFEQYRQLVGGNKGILKATSLKEGKASTQLEAIKIERKILGNDVFAPPAGYKELRMGDMMMQAHKAMQQEHQPQHADQGQKPEEGQEPDSEQPPARSKPY